MVHVAQDFTVKFLAEGSPLTVLGTTLTLQDPTQHEVQHRVVAGWKMFYSLKSLLLHKTSSLKKRLRLFDATVGSCVLWCSQSWSMRNVENQLLRTTQRSMLRKIVGSSRNPETEYITWIQDATHRAVQIAQDAGVRFWGDAHSRSKWLWAGHVARRPSETWLSRVTCWRDSHWQSVVDELGNNRPMRPSRRVWTRWEDPIRRFSTMQGLRDWRSAAAERNDWADRAQAFTQWCTKV